MRETHAVNPVMQVLLACQFEECKNESTMVYVILLAGFSSKLQGSKLIKGSTKK